MLLEHEMQVERGDGSVLLWIGQDWVSPIVDSGSGRFSEIVCLYGFQRVSLAVVQYDPLSWSKLRIGKPTWTP